MPNSTLVYVRCEDEDVVAEIEAAWAPYHPSRRSDYFMKPASLLLPPSLGKTEGSGKIEAPWNAE